MQVHYDEGVAIHIGPEPCAVIREGGGEASVGEGTGQPLSREIYAIPGCRRRFECGRQHGRARYRKRPNGPAWSENLACADAPWYGNREIPRLTSAVCAAGPHREGEEP